MGSAGTIRRNLRSGDIPFPFRHHFSVELRPRSAVVVSADAEIRAVLAGILRECSLACIPANGFAELKSAFLESAPVACLCGFDLADGTFRDVMRFLDEQSIQVPVVMISPRAAEDSPSRFFDSLRAGAIATVCYPYRLTDVQVLLWSAIQYQHASPE